MIDLHSDIMMDVIYRRAKGEQQVFAHRHLPVLQAAGYTALGLTFFVELEQCHRPAEQMRELMGALKAELADSAAEITLVRTPAEAVAAHQAGKFAILLTVEGMAALAFNDRLMADLCQMCLTSGMLTWNEANAFASGFPGFAYAEARALVASGKANYLIAQAGQADAPAQGLTDRGRDLIRAMADAGVMLDLSHLNEPSFWDAISAYPDPPNRAPIR